MVLTQYSADPIVKVRDLSSITEISLVRESAFICANASQPNIWRSSKSNTIASDLNFTTYSTVTSLW
ncbi:MAG TPA: hypothetical protein V6D28_17680 [Leptolyngbyaceae cyanobacterium]